MRHAIGPDHLIFPSHPATLAWAGAARAAALPLLEAPEHAHWWRHGRTWFAGVNILPNTPEGGIGGAPLEGPAIDWLERQGARPARWDRAQVSVVRPGYPRQDPGESDAAHAFRKNRDAAHLDGLLPVGPERRRKMREHHAFILGLPLSEADPDASPLVIWEGSHRIMAAMLEDALGPYPPEGWAEIDLTAVYAETRKRVFDTCRRRTLHVAPGGAILLHRFTVHGISPWRAGAGSAPEGRVIAYFRPAMSLKTWLLAPWAAPTAKREV